MNNDDFDAPRQDEDPRVRWAKRFRRKDVKALLFTIAIVLELLIIWGVLTAYRTYKIQPHTTPAPPTAYARNSFYTCPDCNAQTEHVGLSDITAWFNAGLAAVRAAGLYATLETTNFCDACRTPDEPDPWFYVNLRHNGKQIKTALEYHDFNLLAAWLRHEDFVILDDKNFDMKLFEPRIKVLLGLDDE